MEIYKNVLCAGKSWPMPIHFVARHKFRRWSRVDAEGRRFEKATRTDDHAEERAEMEAHREAL